MSGSRLSEAVRTPLVLCAAGAGLVAIGCESPFDALDARTEALIVSTTAELDGDAVPPSIRRSAYASGDALSFPDEDRFDLETFNPSAEEIPFEGLDVREAAVDEEADEVLRQIEAGDVPPPVNAIQMDLAAALAFAMQQSREYRTAEEEYLLSALRLLIERHQWGPRFFDEVSATISGDADDATFDTALRLVNEFRVTQRLPYGGEVSARVLANATEDLHRRVAGENVQTADFLLSANLPLLRGAGLAAIESKIQAERNLIYGAREFERFRREYLVDISRAFLNLVVAQQGIQNAEKQLIRLIQFEEREQALVESGRVPPFEAALTAQDVLFARDRLRSQRENYRLSVDQFKVRLGMPIDQEIVIVPSTLGLPVPATDADQAVRLALLYRLDLQTRRDQLEDSRRQVDIAKNDLLPDLDLSASFAVPTDDERDRQGLRFNTEESSFAAGITFGLPLDREIERIGLRQTQISAERAEREYTRFRDGVVIDVRDAVREIERSLFSLRIQEENIRIARLRLESIEAAPDRATARDRSEAADDLTEAENQRDEARRDLEISILEYLLSTGTLRVNERGLIEPLAGMEIIGRAPTGEGGSG